MGVLYKRTFKMHALKLAQMKIMDFHHQHVSSRASCNVVICWLFHVGMQEHNDVSTSHFMVAR